MKTHTSKLTLVLVTVLAAAAGGEAALLYRAHQDRTYSQWNNPWLNADRGPFADMTQMESRMDQLFGIRPVGTFAVNQVLTPHLNLKDTGKAYSITAELPGLDKSDINVSLDGQLLSVSGTRNTKQRTGWFGRKQETSGISRFEEAVELPDAVDASHMKAVYKHGVLKVTVPKAEQEDGVRKVPVQ